MGPRHPGPGGRRPLHVRRAGGGGAQHEADLDCVGAAHDADRARRMAQELAPDVILMDVNLGDQDGLDLTAELVAAHPELRVVVLTAHADGAAMRRAAAAGACALLPKDGSLPDLLNGLRSARPGGLSCTRRCSAPW